jgi:hypothetical protein
VVAAGGNRSQNRLPATRPGRRSGQGPARGCRDLPLPCDGECAFVALRIGEFRRAGSARSPGSRPGSPTRRQPRHVVAIADRSGVPTTGARTGVPKDLAEGRRSRSSIGCRCSCAEDQRAAQRRSTKSSSATELQPPLAPDDRERSRSSRCRDARLCAGTALSSSAVQLAGGWALPRHQRRVANTGLATAPDDNQQPAPGARRRLVADGKRHPLRSPPYDSRDR